MKAIIITISIFLTSIFAQPLVTTARAESASTTSEIFNPGGGPKINKKSAKRFKTHKGVKRNKNTCMKKFGCKPKLRNQKKTKCGGYH